MQPEADYNMTNAAFNADNGRYLGDSSLLVKFFLHPKLNTSKSAENGRPIFEELTYISIMQPGNKDSVVMRPATSEDKMRFAEHFRKYEAREDQDAVEGTLLSEWPGVTRSQCEELRFFNVRTVEQLVAVSDAHTGRVMGINMLKERAKKYLEAAGDNKTVEALLAANSRIDELTSMMEKMAARLKEAEED